MIFYTELIRYDIYMDYAIPMNEAWCNSRSRNSVFWIIYIFDYNKALSPNISSEHLSVAIKATDQSDPILDHVGLSQIAVSSNPSIVISNKFLIARRNARSSLLRAYVVVRVPSIPELRLSGTFPSWCSTRTKSPMEHRRLLPPSSASNSRIRVRCTVNVIASRRQLNRDNILPLNPSGWRSAGEEGGRGGEGWRSRRLFIFANTDYGPSGRVRWLMKGGQEAARNFSRQSSRRRDNGAPSGDLFSLSLSLGSRSSVRRTAFCRQLVTINEWLLWSSCPPTSSRVAASRRRFIEFNWAANARRFNLIGA